MRKKNRILWIGVRELGYENIRRAEILRRLRGIDRYALRLHDRRIIRGCQRYLLLPMLTFCLALFYPLLFCTDRRQIRFFPRKVVYDCDDPVYSAEEAADLSRDNVAAIVVPTCLIRENLRKRGIKAAMEIIPQGVSLDTVDRSRIAFYRQAYCRNAGEIVVGMHQPEFYLQSECTNRTNADLYVADFLLESMTAVHQQIPLAALWLVGHVSDGIIRFAKANSWIKLLGYHPHDELMNLVSAFDIGLYPRTMSLGGRSCLKILEYMACGVPVVGMSVVEMDIINKVGAGIVAKSSDDFVSSIVQLCQDGVLRKELGKRGKKHAAEFTWERVADSYQTLLDSHLP